MPLQIILHEKLATDVVNFDLENIAKEINEKLIRRHRGTNQGRHEVVDRYETKE